MKRLLFVWIQTHKISYSEKPAEGRAWINVSEILLRMNKGLFLEFSLEHIGVIDA
jgi:hypothetical protein